MSSITDCSFLGLVPFPSNRYAGDILVLLMFSPPKLDVWIRQRCIKTCFAVLTSLTDASYYFFQASDRRLYLSNTDLSHKRRRQPTFRSPSS